MANHVTRSDAEQAVYTLEDDGDGVSLNVEYKGDYYTIGVISDEGLELYGLNDESGRLPFKIQKNTKIRVF